MYELSTPISDAAIDVAHLVKVYKRATAVNDISFKVARSSVTALLGGNGAGKTTTIGMIMGLVRPTSGTVHVLGHRMPDESDAVLGRMNFESPYIDMPMRLTVRELGGLGWATTDLVNARSLLERNPRALQLIATSAEDQPLAIQLFGAVPEEMRDAALFCQEQGVAGVDINMGCPVKKVVSIGGGAAMMTELAKTGALVRGMVEALKIPVTAKMRLGWDDENITAPELVRVLEDTGVAAIFIHGRTRAQGFSGTVPFSSCHPEGLFHAQR